MPFAATGRSKPHPTTAATSHSARTNHVSVPTPACLLASAASPSTSSSQTRPAPSARTATAPLSRASITCLKSWRFHSVEQPWGVTSAIAADLEAEGVSSVDQLLCMDPVLLTIRTGLPFDLILRLAAQAITGRYLTGQAAGLLPL